MGMVNHMPLSVLTPQSDHCEAQIQQCLKMRGQQQKTLTIEAPITKCCVRSKSGDRSNVTTEREGEESIFRTFMVSCFVCEEKNGWVNE